MAPWAALAVGLYVVGAWIDGTIDLRYAPDVRRHLLGLCIGSLPMVLAVNLINGALLYVALRATIGWRPLAVWYALIVLMVLARYLVGR